MPPPVTDAATALLRAVRVHFVHFAGFVLEEIRSRRWASITFRGARHELVFRLEGEGAEEWPGSSSAASTRATSRFAAICSRTYRWSAKTGGRAAPESALKR
jgi:hypothetical protein